MPDYNPGPATTSSDNPVGQFYNPESASYGVVYVKTDGNDLNDGLTWHTAKGTIQTGINTLPAGGGTVFVGPGKFTIYAPITPISGVTVRGSGWQYSNVTNTFVNGTILIAAPNTSIDCFAWDTVARAVQPSQATIYATALYNFSVTDMGFQGFTRAIHIGDLMAAGGFYCRFENLMALNCTQWGLYFENVSYSIFNNLTVYNWTANPTGMMFFGCSQSNYNHGNNRGSYIFAENSNGYGPRGIVFMARTGNATATSFNFNNFYHVQCNNTGSAQLQAATCTGSSPTISVTDGTKYPKDMPVTFDNYVNGFTKFQTYFVIANGVPDGLSANQIQLSDKQSGTARNSTGSTAVNIVSLGFPAVEIVAQADTGNNITGSRFDGVDAEGTATCNVLVQNAGATVNIGTTNPISQGITNGTVCSTLVARSGVGSMGGNWSCVTSGFFDLDQQSTKQWYCQSAVVANDLSSNALVQYNPIGTYYLRSEAYNVWNILGATLSGNGFTVNNTLHAQQDNNGAAFLYPAISVGQLIQRNSTASVSLWAGQSGTMVYNGSGTPTWTLPAINTATAEGKGNSSMGMVFEIVNANSTSGALTLNTSSSQKFGYGGSAKTSYSVPQGGSITVRAAYDGTSGFWAVLSINGAT